MSAALQYALSQTLILPFAQVDGDAESQPASTPKPAAAPTDKPQGERRSAHDGRVLKPGEDPKPKVEPDETAFEGRLYDAMTLVGVTSAQLKAYLVKKGIITEAVEIGHLPEKIVTAMLDGTDRKTNKNNWELIVDAIKKGAK